MSTILEFKNFESDFEKPFFILSSTEMAVFSSDIDFNWELRFVLVVEMLRSISSMSADKVSMVAYVTVVRYDLTVLAHV